MRNVEYYSYKLTANNNVLLTAGNHTLSCSFFWPEAVQTQYDVVTRQIGDLAKSDPIINADGTYNRTYDYADYYTSIPAYGEEMEAWWAEQVNIPQSLKGIEAPYDILEERRELCIGIKAYLEDLKDQLVYQCVIIDETGYKTVMSVRTGAYCRWRDTSWSLRFVADIPEIGKNDLDKTTVEVMSYEFI